MASTTRGFGGVARGSLGLVLAANLLTTGVQLARVDRGWVHGRLAAVTAAQTVTVPHGLPGLLSTDRLPYFIACLGLILVQKVLLLG